MKLLALDTATAVCGVAVWTGDRPACQVSLHIPRIHSVQLMPMVRYALAQTGLALKELDGVAVSIGPGSFTGLRLGVMTAKTLGFAAGLKLAAVPTLEALAAALPGAPGLTACASLDGRRDEVYAACFRWDGAWKRLGPDEVLSREQFSRLLTALPPATLFAGEGQSSAAAVAAVGAELLKAGRGADPLSVEPMYLRQPLAQARTGCQRG